MIKAVFFDWFNTLARYEPPREQIHSQALREFGFEVTPEQVAPGLMSADRYFFEENAKSPIRKRPAAEQAAIYARYENMILAQAGMCVSAEESLKIMEMARRLAEGTRFVLFDDALPVLKLLKTRKLITGLLTNLDKDMGPVCRELGLQPYLKFVVTSAEVGADKPQPPIFLAALERAGVTAAEAIHVGDQYSGDIVGARGVGIAAILLDRQGSCSDVCDCPRIRALAELPAYLDGGA